MAAKSPIKRPKGHNPKSASDLAEPAARIRFGAESYSSSEGGNHRKRASVARALFRPGTVFSRDAMVSWFMSLPQAFFAKTSRRHGIADVPRFAGFPSTGLVWVSPVVLSLWPRFEPFVVVMGGNRVPWFGEERSLAARKSPEFPRRNAKTRWGEPAGLVHVENFLRGHLAVTG